MISALRSDTTTWDPGGKRGTGGRQVSIRSHSGANNKVKEYVNLRVLPKSSKVVSGKTPSPIGWISTVRHSPTESSLCLSFPEEKWHQMRPCLVMWKVLGQIFSCVLVAGNVFKADKTRRNSLMAAVV